MSRRDEFRALTPTNKRQARHWVRLHWQVFMESADMPAIDGDIPAEAVDLIGEVWREEGDRLADRLSRGGR